MYSFLSLFVSTNYCIVYNINCPSQEKYPRILVCMLCLHALCLCNCSMYGTVHLSHAHVPI